MSRRTIASSSSNRCRASARASSVLPTPVGPRNKNEPMGRRGSLRPARARRIASLTAWTAGLLAHHALVQANLHLQQLAHLAFQQPADRDAGPLADYLGDIFRIHLFL